MRVPVYDQQQVQPDALPGMRSQLDFRGTNGEAIAQGMGQLGQGIDRAADVLGEVQHQANATWATNASTQLQHDTTTVLDGNQGGTAGATASQAAGDAAFDDDRVGHAPPSGPSQAALQAPGDPSNGLSSRGLLNEQGLDAAKYSAPTATYLRQRIDEIAAAAPNEAAKRMFLEQALPHYEQTRSQIERHASQQIDAAHAQAAQQGLATSLNQLQVQISKLDPKSPTYDADLRDWLDLNQASASRMVSQLYPSGGAGLSARAKAMLDQYTVTSTSNVMEHLIDQKDARGAQLFFSERRDQLGAKVEDFGKQVKALVDTQANTAFVSSLVDASAIKDAAGNPSGLVDTTKFEPARQERAKAGTLTIALSQAIDHTKAEQDSNNNQVVANRFIAANSAFLKGGHSLAAIAPADRVWLQTYAPEKWEALESKEHQWQVEQRSGRPKSTAPTAEDLALGRARVAMAAQPDTYVKMPDSVFESSFAPYLSADGYRALSKERAELVAKANVPDKDTSTPQTAVQTIMEMGGRNGSNIWNEALPSSKWSANQLSTLNELKKEADDFRAQYKAAHRGGEPTRDDYRKALAPSLREVTVLKGDPGILWASDAQTTVAGYRGIEKYAGKPLVVPDDPNLRAGLADMLRAINKEPTPDKIQGLYQRIMEQGRPLPGAPPAASPPQTAAAPTAPAQDPRRFDPPAVHDVLNAMDRDRAAQRGGPKPITLPTVVLPAARSHPKKITLPTVTLDAARPKAKGPGLVGALDDARDDILKTTSVPKIE